MLTCTSISNSSCLLSNKCTSNLNIFGCNKGWQTTTSSNKARCTGQCSVHNLKYDGSVTVHSTHRIIPTLTTGNL